MAINRVTGFFRAWCLNKKFREWSNSSKYEISAKTNEAFLRKWRKTVEILVRDYSVYCKIGGKDAQFTRNHMNCQKICLHL